MAKLDERMQLIGAAIISQAKTEAAEITRKATQIRDKEIAECEDLVVSNMFGKVQQQAAMIRQESAKTVAKAQMESHRALHLRREELTDAVFETVRQKLMQYAATLEYKAKLLDGAAALKDRFDPADVTVFVRKSDLFFAAEMKTALGGGEVLADDTIQIGGFRARCKNTNMLIDETLDLKLNEQRPWFLRHCNMKTM